jgi:integrase
VDLLYSTIKLTNDRERESEIELVLETLKDSDISESTRRKVGVAVSEFVEFRNLKRDVNVSPQILIEEGRADPKLELCEIRKFFNWLQGLEVEGYPTKSEGVRESTAKERAYSKLCSFFTHNGANFGKGYTPRISEVSDAIRADQDHQFLILNGDHTEIDKTELRNFLNALSPRDRAVGLAMLSSSQDSGDLLKLTVGDFLKQFLNGSAKKTRFYFEGCRAKTNVRFRTFFSEEATRAIRSYLESDRKGAKFEEPLFVINTKSGSVALCPSHLNKAFLYCARSMGLEWDLDELNPFRPKRLRHYFSTCAAQAQISALFTKTFMGHALTVGEKYVEFQSADLELVYSKLEPYLSIFDASEKVQKLSNQLVETTESITELKGLISDLRFQRDTGKEQREKFKTEIIEDVEKAIEEKDEEKKKELINEILGKMVHIQTHQSGTFVDQQNKDIRFLMDQVHEQSVLINTLSEEVEKLKLKKKDRRGLRKI